LRGRSYAVSDSARPACRPEAESLSASVGFSAPRGVYERDFASPAQRANLFDFAGSYTIGNVRYLRTPAFAGPYKNPPLRDIPDHKVILSLSNGRQTD
jgi:hypothetical protein